jgi:hypothetical protein
LLHFSENGKTLTRYNKSDTVISPRTHDFSTRKCA